MRLGERRVFDMKCILILISCLLFISSPASAAQHDNDTISRRLSELLPGDARWALSVVDLKSGAELVASGNTRQPLAPASLVKLITTGAALEAKGEGRPVNLATEVLHDGRINGGALHGNIYLRGNGNCLLTAADLQRAAGIIQVKGITTVTGGVVADATRFGAAGLERKRRGAGHAPVSALGLDLHTVSISVFPGRPGDPPRVAVEPPNTEVRLAVSARSVSGSKSTLGVSRIDDLSYRVTGNIATGSGPLRWRYPLDAPARYAAGSFRTILIRAGMGIRGEARVGGTPENAVLLTAIPGPDLERFVTEINMNSLNVAADNLLLALGASPDGSPGTRERGLDLLRKHLARLGVHASEATVVDGSGLLPGNRITARAMARYLVSAAGRPWFTALRNSLPRAGLDGTLRSGRFKNGAFHVKSGNLENVTALAGYGVDGNGRGIAFAFIVNTQGPLPPNARGVGDEAMRLLAE